MATRNIVPRATGEGSIGTSAKTWSAVYANDIAVTNGVSASTFTGNLTGTASGNLALTGGSITGDVDITGDLSVSGAITGNLAGNADTATNATNDANGNPIAGTYLPLSGGTLTGALNGTEKDGDGNIITVTYLSILNNAGAHSSIYRGKYLGDHVTDEQYDAIDAGTFDNLFIGDYWTINNVNWRIAAFDYWLHCGDTECTTHHVVIVPDTILASCQMNKTNITTGAYVGSDYYKGTNGNTGKSAAQTAINNAFGSAHILNHREHLQNAVTNGYESGGTWYDSKFELMTERMVYGCDIYHNTMHGTNIPSWYSIDKSQLPLFALEPSRITNREGWWLRDVASATNFARVDGGGGANSNNASLSYGVRPAFAIKK